MSDGEKTSDEGTRLAIRTLLFGALLFGVPLVLLRGCMTVLARGAPPGAKAAIFNPRLPEAVERLPAMAAEPRPAIVFGSSIVEAGFSPAVFDARMSELGRPVISYNLGFSALNPKVQLVLAKRIRSTFEASGKKLALSVVEFTPFQATRTRRNSVTGNAAADTATAYLADPRTMLALTVDSPTESAHVLLGKTMGEFPPSALMALVDKLSTPALVPRPPPGPDAEVLEERRKRTIALLEAVDQHHGGDAPAWDPSVRGEHREIYPETQDEYDAYLEVWKKPESRRENLDMRVHTTDIVDLAFDDDLVDAYVALVGELAAASEHTCALIAPIDTAYIARPAAARERLAHVVERIRDEAKVTVIDLQEAPEFDDGDFLDVTHLNETRGRPKLSRMLAERVTEMNERDPGPR